MYLIDTILNHYDKFGMQPYCIANLSNWNSSIFFLRSPLFVLNISSSTIVRQSLFIPSKEVLKG